jgi:phytoene synthase
MNELKSAGISDPALVKSFLAAKELTARHGKTYFLATLLLPPAKRPYVHALYGFARQADDLIDNFQDGTTLSEKADRLRQWSAARMLEIKNKKSNDLIGAALLETINKFNIPVDYFESFLESMAMDINVTSYQTFADLEKYIYGSASVIGLQMLPILGIPNQNDYQLAKNSAIALGNAFQLANFIRDVGEDLHRGRIYLPLAELAEFGVTPETLATKIVDDNLRQALAFQIKRVRELQNYAQAGIKLLAPESQNCIKVASELYCGIVDEVEKIDFQVFNRRAKTSNLRRAKNYFPALLNQKLNF